MRTSIIAEYSNDDWSDVGNLRQPRFGHNAITLGSMTMVIAGLSAGNKEPLV